MAYTHYDRLTALDASFLDLESTGVHMHVGSIGILDPGPLAQADGGIDFDQVLHVAEAGLFRAPRFRQKLDVAPLSGRPIWVAGFVVERRMTSFNGMPIARNFDITFSMSIMLRLTESE